MAAGTWIPGRVCQKVVARTWPPGRGCQDVATRRWPPRRVQLFDEQFVLVDVGHGHPPHHEIFTPPTNRGKKFYDFPKIIAFVIFLQYQDTV